MKTWPLFAITLLGTSMLTGCGKSAEERAREDVALQNRAKAAAHEMLAADQAKFRAIAEGKAVPREATPVRSAQGYGVGTPQRQQAAASSTPVAIPGSTALSTATPAYIPQTFGFDDSPDGKEAKRLIGYYIGQLKDPASAQFRSVRSGPVHTTGSVGYGVCGESNAKNSYGGYTGFSGFVVWRSADGRDNVGQESTDQLQNMVYRLYAKDVGCYAGPI